MRLRVLVIALLPVLAIAVVASALGGGQSELSSLRQATAKYHDLQSAIDAGYVTELPQTAAFGGGTCIANGAEGAMGIHMLDTRTRTGVSTGRSIRPSRKRSCTRSGTTGPSSSPASSTSSRAAPSPSSTGRTSPTRTSHASGTRPRTSGRSTRGSGSRTPTACSILEHARDLLRICSAHCTEGAGQGGRCPAPLRAACRLASGCRQELLPEGGPLDELADARLRDELATLDEHVARGAARSPASR